MNTKMKSAKRGRAISKIEVTNISSHGVWLLTDAEELFLSFTRFPWFRDAAVSDILDVQLLQPWHLYWPGLDVDLDVDSIRHPERFPLVSKLPVKKRRKAS